MSLFTKYLLTVIVSAASLTSACFADQIQTPRNAAIDSTQKVAVAEAAELLDSWRGDSSVLETAKEKLDDVLRADPYAAPAHREYARYHIMSGYVSGNTVEPASLAAAERSLNEAIRLNPTYAEAYVLRGHLYYLQNRLTDAMNALTKAKEIGTEDPWLHLNSADVLMALGRLDEAASSYQSVVASGTKNSKAMLAALGGLINLYESTEQVRKLEETHLQKIAYDPKTAWWYGNYAAFLLCDKDDAEASIVQFRKALELMNYGVARNGLAAALYRKLAMGTADIYQNGIGDLISEAQSLDAGSPLEVVAAFCHDGPAVSAMYWAKTHPSLTITNRHNTPPPHQSTTQPTEPPQTNHPSATHSAPPFQTPVRP